MSRSEARLDRRVAALLAARAFVEIRALAGSAHRASQTSSPAEDLERIRFLANLCHNLPGITQPSRWRPSRTGSAPSSREQAMARRPMGWTWHTAGPEGRAWMLSHIRQYHPTWTPPPALPTARAEALPLTLGQRLGVLLRRWPVQTPAGREPLPAQSQVLKALDSAAICELYAEAGRRRLGLGKGGPWLPAHLDPDGVHYVVPDPASYYWPGNGDGRDGKIAWWQCSVLLRMRNGEQVSGMVAVMPETFAALPSTLARTQQLRLFHRVRSIERDLYLWSRDHKAECDPQRCGYDPAPDPPQTS
ncbi:hypothetical protein Cs7R123_43700 [Catellatospora sp. TT07R-123]|uniref:hypothetical protein n=1 Tax=Catellatospora sp. TT07R-123 TaxID=2733863 RepID=UPI001B031461|nr:hypothetical protein [Catellatospora sp. TT07R-123]GHJ47028.1 hypothetical protein Cs7R123_43700 [Catellatospora sp. TT07R-123]